MAKNSPSLLPKGYGEFLADIKQRVRAAQVRAVLAANSQMILLYWDIGRGILDRQQTEGWGAKVIDSLARDLKTEFPDMKGFSPRNLKYMRAFGEAWPDREFVQQVVAQLPWGQNVRLLDRIADSHTRAWYARKCLERGWSRDMLLVQIESRLHEREGKALTNFKTTLPAPQSDLAQQALKDPYVFDFLTLDAAARERELEQGLLDHIQKFMLEMGVGFALSGGRSTWRSAGRTTTSTCCSITSNCAASSSLTSRSASSSPSMRAR